MPSRTQPMNTPHKRTSANPEAFQKNLVMSLMAITSHWDSIAALQPNTVGLALKECSRHIKEAVEDARNGLVAKFSEKSKRAPRQGRIER